MNEPRVKAEPAEMTSVEFYDRARARLTFDVPPGLIDPNIIPETGDPGTDKMLEIMAREYAMLADRADRQRTESDRSR